MRLVCERLVCERLVCETSVYVCETGVCSHVPVCVTGHSLVCV